MLSGEKKLTTSSNEARETSGRRMTQRHVHSEKDEGWMTARRKNGVTFNSGDAEWTRRSIFPVKHYWNGFDRKGKEQWYLELNTGRVISYRETNYKYWLGIFKKGR